MGEAVITTGVDDLITFLKQKDRVAMQDAATVLNVPLETMQAWVDFLVEEKILGIEYKFTKPFIYLNREESKKEHAKIVEKAIAQIEDVRNEYVEHARSKQIPTEKILQLWRGHVVEALGRKKEYFVEQAMRHHTLDTEGLWESYQKNLLLRC